MRIKLTEQQFKRIILREQRASVSFPVIVRDTFDSGGNCDRLHAFQSSSGKVVGNMNVIVGDKLKEIYNLGYNPEVTQVDVIVNGDKVTWTVTIKESTDGKAWIGFTSRGSGCHRIDRLRTHPNHILNRATSTHRGNDVGTLRKAIISAGLNKNNNFDLEMVNEFVYRINKKLVKDSFKQVFYRYTRPTGYPPHSSSSSSSPTPKPITIPKPYTKTSRKVVTIKGDEGPKELTTFMEKLEKESANKIIDLDNIKFYFSDLPDDPLIEYEETPNGTPIYKLILALSSKSDDNTCPACEAIKNKNKHKSIVEGNFDCDGGDNVSDFLGQKCRYFELIALIK